MRRLLTTLFFVAMALAATAQNRIPGSNVVFGFPNGGWKYLNTIDVDQTTKVYLYSYSARTVIGSDGDTVLPHMRIYEKKNSTEPLFDLVWKRYEYNPYQSLVEYTEGLPSSDGIGYKGVYKNLKDAKEYMFNMIYFKDRTTAYEVRIETTLDTYEEFEKEFDAIMETFKLEK